MLLQLLLSNSPQRLIAEPPELLHCQSHHPEPLASVAVNRLQCQGMMFEQLLRPLLLGISSAVLSSKHDRQH